ncbi:MAG: hypothetical protein KUG74_03505 [Rhodobacteraceae bacterium]|nr:hypothetical protein [Paracoccaceae bacterium]
MEDTIKSLSTRLFPKNHGASAYQVSGIAARCDWVVLTDWHQPKTMLHQNVSTTQPQHIFLSLREPFTAIRYFVEQIIPGLSAPFVLVSGSEDVTVPHQIDQRWRPFNAQERSLIEYLLGHPLLLHWFAENLDDNSHPRMSPLPLGMVFTNNYVQELAVPEIRPLRDRQPRILCAHRARPGPQWDIRREVSRLARTEWKQWCTVLDEEVSEDTFLDLVQQHAFVLCVEGGGIDPSPKAWQTILYGAVPIIRATPLQAAYRQLPVALIPDWQSQHITKAKLDQWFNDPSLHQELNANRKKTLERLGIDYWWHQIAAKALDGSLHQESL